ncbi:MAG: hypothetical protein JO159_18395 [Acidobacteria bacterium]|nr:hypothetical protein [Acidobacteriota bacterium]MBV9624535.1 hypothetical protein [Acidobacteriota bacterium]
MLARILDSLFRCMHRRYSFPITLKQNPSARAAGIRTYVVCLDCGKELPYDWDEMRIVKPGSEPVAVVSLAAKEAS